MMRKAYRNMMGQVTLSEGAREGVLRRLEGAPAGKKRVPLGRVAMAACLCLALALPVAAAVSGLWLRFQPEESRWEASVPLPVRMPVSAFSQQVRELAARQGPKTVRYAVDDMAAAEEFLGVPLPDNPLLNGAQRLRMEYLDGESGDTEGHCFVWVGSNVDGVFMAVHTEARYRYRGTWVELWCAIPTELNPYENGGGIGQDHGDNIAAAALSREEYVTPSGRACALMLLEEGDGRELYGCTGYGYVLVDSVLAQLTVRGKDAAQTRSILTELLDAYG